MKTDWKGGAKLAEVTGWDKRKKEEEEEEASQ